MNSLALRLFTSAIVWIFLTLLGTGIVLSDLNKQSNLKAFDDKLNLLLETLIGASKIDSSNSITVISSIGDPRFFQPYSGWYWQINNGAKTLSRSRSMWDQVFTLDKRLIGGRAQFLNSSLQNIDNQKKDIVEKKELQILQREISFPGFSGPLTFIVSGDTIEFRQNVEEFNQALSISLMILGLGLLFAVYLQVHYGLLPLNKIKNSLFKIRNGDATKLEETYPLEVQPLASEINDLIQHNEKIIDRAKTHVGNLAHVLKTPLAVISNESSTDNIIMRNQLELMRKHIDRYLKKAHLDASGKVAKEKLNLSSLLKKMIKIFNKLYPNVTIKLTEKSSNLFVYSSLEDMEEVIGNLLENSCKWTSKLIKININKFSENEIKFVIEDDGPGLAEEQLTNVFARGFRLDEQKPGTGLGLNIVKDIVETYKGKVWLTRSKNLGGLKVNVLLPMSKK